MQIVDLVSRAIWDLAAWFSELTISTRQQHTNLEETNPLSKTLSCGLPECTDEMLCRVDKPCNLTPEPSAPPLPPDVPQELVLGTPTRCLVLAPVEPTTASPVLGVRSPRPQRLPPHRAVQLWVPTEKNGSIKIKKRTHLGIHTQ